MKEETKKTEMERKAYVDLHMHTFYSDGLDDPQTLVRNSANKGIEMLAITDHDIMTGYFEGLKEAERWGIRLIPGVEVTTRNYDILGLNVDPLNSEFQDFLKKIQDFQVYSCKKRMADLQKLGIPLTYEKLRKEFPKSRVGSFNLAMALLADPSCRSIINERYGNVTTNEVYSIYFGKKGLVKKSEESCVGAREAIEQIHKAGGIAVVAHPFKQVRIDEVEKRLDELIERGLDGIEIQPNFGEENRPFLDYAQRKGIPITYGSDYHGSGFIRGLLGRGENSLSYDFFERKAVK